MNQADHFLHTTHRTVAWFNKALMNNELVLSAPFQRNPVWTDIQKAYLIDTILNGLPIPELYMQDIGDSSGGEKHIVVDGQQRIRSILEFIEGKYCLEGDEVAKAWRGFCFDDLSENQKKIVFGYKFVVRVLPPMEEDDVRRIFSRLNRNVVPLNEQELRNATYWGPFIKTIHEMADQDMFWSESGIFSANDHRRMLDQEFISELAIGFLYGPQNKKDKLDHYYRVHEESFDDKDYLRSSFRRITDEISILLPKIRSTRWRKKSDFYTLFSVFAGKLSEMPWSSDERSRVADRLAQFDEKVTKVLSLDESEWENVDPNVTRYAKHVSRAASDRTSRVARADALTSFIFWS
jgi:hypothetical protein